MDSRSVKPAIDRFKDTASGLIVQLMERVAILEEANERLALKLKEGQTDESETAPADGAPEAA